MFGSWFSSALHSVGGWVAGDGNTPGNPDTRSLGYDSDEVAKAVAIELSQPAAPNVQQELLVGAVVGVALIFLLRQSN